MEDLTNWEQVKSLSKSEIEANALSDPDNQPLSPDTINTLKELKESVRGNNVLLITITRNPLLFRQIPD